MFYYLCRCISTLFVINVVKNLTEDYKDRYSNAGYNSDTVFGVARQTKKRTKHIAWMKY